MSKKWDFFLAYASGDKHQAEALYKLLFARSKTFLDSQSLLPGDDWPQLIPEAQKDSLITIVLISSKTDKAYYQREEIAAAIEMAREDRHTHRVVPVYLDDQVNNKPPYGLRLLQAIRVSELGSLDGVANRLLGLLEGIGENKKIDGHSEGRKAPRLLNWKYILPVFVIALIILALSWSAYLGNEPSHKAELTKCIDSADKEIDKTDSIKYVTRAKWWPLGIHATDTGWKVNESGTPNYRSIEDDKIGLLKCRTSEIYTSYKDFAFEFKAKPMSEGVAWVARADFQNYYLFEIIFPKDEKEGIFLGAYVYKNNEKSLIGDKRFYGLDKPIEFVHVKMNIIDNDFYLCLSTYPPLVSKEISDVSFHDENRTFPLGGIGFASRPGFEMLLGEVLVRPGANFSENHCQ